VLLDRVHPAHLMVNKYTMKYNSFQSPPLGMTSQVEVEVLTAADRIEVDHLKKIRDPPVKHPSNATVPKMHTNAPFRLVVFRSCGGGTKTFIASQQKDGRRSTFA